MFYLVLRGLDTIEDDMSILDEVKQPILRSFHLHTVTPGWKYDGCGPGEKDRQLLVEYDTIVDEVNRLAPEYGFQIFSSAPRLIVTVTNPSSLTLHTKWPSAWPIMPTKRPLPVPSTSKQ